MDKLQLPHAKLFYFSAELYKNSTITENEKLKMKGNTFFASVLYHSLLICILLEMVINDEP